MRKILLILLILGFCSVAEARKYRPAVYQGEWIVYRQARFSNSDFVAWEFVCCDDLDADTDEKIWERYQRGEFKLYKMNSYPTPIIESDWSLLVKEIRKDPDYYGLEPMKSTVHSSSAH